MRELDVHARKALDEALSQHGLRPTVQRTHVFGVLLHKRDHPTADEVFVRAKEGLPGISLATVYNCLETLVACQLVRQVNYEREPTRYCPNLATHAHFHDAKTGRVYDVDLPPALLEKLKKVLPEGWNADTVELSFRGRKTKAS